MVHRLEKQRDLTDPLLREALLNVRREVLLPRACVRRDAGYPEPVVLQLLDGAHPEDQEEWLDLIYSGASERWVRAGRPESYRLEPAADGRQYVCSGQSAAALAWELPKPAESVDENEGESTNE
ncbi:hypothetical protein [Streptomyces triculaminicus]|uniref:hypothetical protein n=1 Tax=Streptomyces triculaminicus TaxID=2816232 RepID=UPI0037D26790